MVAVARAEGEPQGQATARVDFDQGVEHAADDPAAAVAIPAVERAGIGVAAGMVAALGTGAVTGLVAMRVAAALQVGAVAGAGDGGGVTDQAAADRTGDGVDEQLVSNGAGSVLGDRRTQQALDQPLHQVPAGRRQLLARLGAQPPGRGAAQRVAATRPEVQAVEEIVEGGDAGDVVGGEAAGDRKHGLLMQAWWYPPCTR